jgi:asparagine synthase (glutamine-hydrolysing)
MCGITGWVDWNRDLRGERTVVSAMTDSMACRGPDARGLWLSDTAAIGHRRLAIIDLSGGTQPMVTTLAAEGGRVVLTYSGELYNFRELRRLLQSHGHRFETRSDTEVVLRSYVQWGPSCVERFNGMFAFAIWDENEQELLLARDHLGIKPLYYHAYHGGLLFGSEPKAIIANPLYQPALDDVGLAELFAMFGSRTPGVTALRGLDEVRPGHIVRVGRTGVRQIRYWQLESAKHLDDPRTTAHTVREILADTVARQLVSEVPLCTLVSGGLDSSVIAALAARELANGRSSRSLSTFAVDFTGSEEDFVADANRPDLDAPYVRTLVGHIGSRHTDVVLGTPDLLEVQERATLARDLPCLGDLDASLYMLFAAIQGRSTVALSGESADEVFGGYAWFHDSAAVARAGFPWIMDDAGFGNVLAPDVKARVRPEEYVRDRYAEALAEVPRLAGETGQDRRMREVSYLALTRFLPVLLDRKDRMSMAVGLEVRVPYCDHRLVEYLWNVPWAVKCPDGVPKGLLRAAAADLLPPQLLHRRKSMYPAVPDPAYDATIRRLATQLVESDSAVGPLLDAERVRALADGSSRRPPWMQRLALAYLVQIDLWMRRYGVRVLVPA